MHVKYEASTSYGSNVMTKDKVFLPQIDRQTDSEQKLDALEFHSGGIKRLSPKTQSELYYL